VSPQSDFSGPHDPTKNLSYHGERQNENCCSIS
jgi:hypothetical protein